MLVSETERKKLKLQCPILCRGDSLPFLNCSEGWYALIEEMMVQLEEMCRDYQAQGKEPLPKLFNIEPDRGEMTVRIDDMTSEMDELVEYYRERSETTCENCGEPSQLRGGWIQTLCDACSKKPA